MIYLKQYENFDNSGRYVGKHCSDYDISEFRSEITDEDYIRFADVLYLLKYDYPEATEYLEKLNNIDQDGDEEVYEEEIMELASEIESFFKENDLEWIYVSEEPLYKYGDICYDVYFQSNQDLYYMSDDLVEDATVYIYKKTTNKPNLIQEY